MLNSSENRKAPVRNIKKSPKRLRLRRLIVILLIAAAAELSIIYYESAHQIAGFSRKPVIELKGDDNLTLYLGDKYKDPGYTASAFNGKDLTGRVKVRSSAIRSDSTIMKTGNYKVHYTVTDNGQTAAKVRNITVTYHKPDPEDPDHGHGIAVCMYHNVYDPDNPPLNVDSNYISTDDLDAQLRYLVDNNYYFPTWKELRRYIDGEIDLPVKSVVLTFDDCDKLFQQYGIPLLEKEDVRATSFVICTKNGKSVLKKYKNLKHVSFQSHSYDMHKPGGTIGHGGIFTALTEEEGVKDLKKSIDMLGTSDAFAYPFGDYTDTCEEAVKEAGFLCAFTTEYGQVHPGDDPYLLPRVRINGGCTVDEFAQAIQPDTGSPAENATGSDDSSAGSSAVAAENSSSATS